MASPTGRARGTGIFVPYRRDDSADTTGRMYDRLVDRFGREHVFRMSTRFPSVWIFASIWGDAWAIAPW